MKRGILASYVLLFAGFVLVSLSSGSNITGNFVFGESFGTFGSLAGLIFIGASIGLFLAEGGLEQKAMKPGKEFKSIRRNEEKKQNKKLSNEDAEQYVDRAWNKYATQVQKGQIEKSDHLPEGKSPYKRVDERAEELTYENEDSSMPIYISEQAIKRAKKDSHVNRNLKRYMSELKKLVQNPDDAQVEPLGDFYVSPQGGINERIAWNKDREGNLYIQDLLYHVDGNKYVDNWATRAKQRKIRKQDYTGHEETKTSHLTELLAA